MGLKYENFFFSLKNEKKTDTEKALEKDVLSTIGILLR
jgi:hypothetical protein